MKITIHIMCAAYHRLTVLLCCLLNLTASLSSQVAKERYFTHPFLKEFNRKDYNASTQNWIVVQDGRGVVYIGNGQGVLEYNGRDWRLIKLDNGSAVRTMTIAGDSTLFVAGEDELGYLAPDALGALQYHSLLSHLAEKDRDFGTAWFAHTMPNGIYFQTGSHLIRWSGAEMDVWYPDVRFNTSAVVHGTLYVHSYGKGLMRMVDDSLVLIPGSEQFAEEWLFVMLPFDEGSILLGTRDRGFFLYDGVQFIPFPTEIDEFLQTYTLYLPGAILKDGTIALGTTDAGVLILDRQGRLLQHIDRKKGLPNDNVHYVFQDREQGLWLALNNGIVRLEIPAPASFINAEMGLPQGIMDMDQHHGMLYVGTREGLFIIDENQGKVMPVPTASESVWNLLSVNETLFAATNGGILRIDNGQLSKWELWKEQETKDYPAYSIHQSRLDSQLMFVGKRNGLDIIRFAADRPQAWALLGSVAGVEKQVSTIHELVRGQLTLTTDGGVFRMTYTDSTLLNPTLEKLDTQAGLPAESASAYEAGGQLYYTSGDGLYSFDSVTSRYVRQDSLFPGISFEDAVKFAGLFNGNNGNVWITAKHGIYLAKPTSSGTYEIHGEEFLRYADWTMTSVYSGLDSVLWFGGIDGLVRYDQRVDKPMGTAARPLLSRITLNQDSVHFGGTGAPVMSDPDNKSLFEYPNNTVRFDYQAPIYEVYERVQYQTRLLGFEEEWSQWSDDTWRTYTNLPRGQYTFQARAKNAYGAVSDPVAYTFDIQPPWWYSWWAWLFYALMGSLMMYSWVNWRTAGHRRKLEEANRLNDRLQQVDRLKDQFLANTSHELRTPLQGIIGLSESLYEREAQRDKQEDLAMIISSGKRLNNLVNDILDFSKLKNSDIQLIRKPVGLHALVDVVLKNNAPLAKGKKLELINAVPEQLPAAFADENRLQQVLFNLVGNAIKFTETGYIKISATETGNWLEIRVEDTGTGIPVNKRDAIFQEFEQVDGSIGREFAGTGLGLSISKRLVELHGGEMWVESEVGKGSTFYFSLPATPDAAAIRTSEVQVSPVLLSADGTEPAVVSPPTAIVDDNTVRILVVDDEPINQQVLKNHLAGRNFQITQAMNGEEGLKKLAEEPDFDLVLLDVMMPRMSGYEVCQQIREKYLPSELPVIMITARNQIQDIVQGLSLGANDYLAKPFYKEELLARIKTQVDLHHIFDVAGRFVPNEFLHSLNRERITEVALGDHTELNVTVLFTDIRDYTGLAETMTPQENFKFVNAFHGRMGPIIKQNSGFINQYLGDAIMAIFPEGPEGALSAAIGMQHSLIEYNEHRLADGRQPIRIGAGLHSGPLIMGIIGDRNRMDAATIADTVNTASRIESLSKHYGTSILLSEDSVGQLKEKENFHLRYLGKVQVKGKKEPVGLYECFDGDNMESVRQKAKTLPDFEAGLDQFFSKNFAEASATFNRILKSNATDQPARIFMTKAGKNQIEGVPDDWTGVEVMTFK